MTRPGPAQVVAVALIPLAFLLGGGSLLMHAGPRLIEGLAARSWPEAQGRVVEARVEEVDLGGRGPGTKRWFEVRVAYEFDAGGGVHHGDRGGLRPERWLAPQAKEIAANYEVGRPQAVYYDPSDPDRCLLDRSIGGGTWATAIAGVALSILGLSMSIGFVRALRRG